MNGFDRVVMSFFSFFAGKFPLFDEIMHHVSTNDLLRGAMLISFLWAFWFTRDEAKVETNRKKILTIFMGIFIGICITRILEMSLPFRPRPFLNKEILLNFPSVWEKSGWRNSSSFPSDTATLFSSLATGIFLLSRKFGVCIIGYVLFLIFFPRVYLGLHYPTDMIAGGIIGMFPVLLADAAYFRKNIVDKAYPMVNKHPEIFYMVFFLLCFEIASLFEGSREIAGFLIKVLLAISHRVI